MRFQCDFCKACPKHIGSENRPCRACGHGACWHRRAKQFESSRERVRKGTYNRERIEPMVPPLPYCECVVALPV
mgnify:CR=1|jgi:hypothetical protein